MKKHKKRKQLEADIREARKQLREEEEESRIEVEKKYNNWQKIHESSEKTISNRNPKAQTRKTYCRRGNESLT